MNIRKTGFLVFFITCALLFFSCNFLFGNNTSNPGFVEPLLQTRWGQGNPFNSMLPEGHRSFCGLLTMAQIMKYHNHPVRGIGQSEPYTTSNGVFIPSVNFGATNYDWGNMLNTYTSSATGQQRNAVATLVYHAGVARGRNFSSGVDRYNFSYALTAFFGYDRSILRLERRFYDDAAWEAIIREQLDSGLPVQYVGYEPGDNHSFIIDGYDSIGRFHINWGWAGMHNGWYFLNNFNYSGERRWNDNQYIHINIMPDRGGVPLPYEMALNSFTASKTTIPPNELFTISAQVRNLGTLSSFPGGQIGAALVNNNGNIVTVFGMVNFNELNPLSNRTISINSFVPGNIASGQYQLRMVIRPTDGEWEIITKSSISDGVPNAINFTITPEGSVTPGGGYGQRLENFTTELVSAVHNETTRFVVTLRMRNTTTESFSGGQHAVALLDSAGNIVSILGTIGSGGLGAGMQNLNVRDINCTILPNTIAPGQYSMRILVRPNTTDGEWRIATLANTGVSNIYEFTVQ